MEVFWAAPLFIAFILTVWFETEAVVEYANLFGFYKFIKHLKSFRQSSLAGSSISYRDYLAMYHNNFFVRLITCEICLTTWFSMIFGAIISFIAVKYNIANLFFATIYSLALPYLTLFAFRLIRKIR